MPFPFHISFVADELRRRQAKNQKYSMRAFAKFLETHPSALSRILSGKQEMSIAVALQVISKLKLDPDDQEKFVFSVAQEKYKQALSILSEGAKIDQLSTALRESEERYQALINVVDQTVSVQELVRSEDGRVVDAVILRVNPMWVMATGLSPANACQRRLTELFPETAKELLEQFEEAARTHMAVKKDLHFKERDLWYDSLIVPLGGDRVMLAGLDTTERRILQEKVRRSEARLKMVLESLPFAVGVTDEEGNLVLSNREMRHYLPTSKIPALDSEQAVRWKGVTKDGQPLPPSEFTVARALRGEEYGESIEMTFKADDGTDEKVMVTSKAVRDEQKKITGAFILVEKKSLSANSDLKN